MEAAVTVPGLFIRRSTLLLLGFTLSLGGCGRFCGGVGNRPPAPLPIVKDARTGQTFYVLDRGEYKAYYDSLGQLVRIEHDTNQDGRAEEIARYDGKKNPSLVEVDENSDGWIDRWEYYDEKGTLLSVGRWHKTKGQPDEWTSRDGQGRPVRIEHDDDGDGRKDRTEVLEREKVVALEIDADRDGRTDRWQKLDKGRLVSEDLDTNGDGKADRRLRFKADGTVQGIERLTP
jgi:hypothetical protein